MTHLPPPQNSLSALHSKGTPPWMRMNSDKLRLIAPLDACSCSSIWEIAATRTREMNFPTYDWRASEAPASTPAHDCICSRPGRRSCSPQRRSRLQPAVVAEMDISPCQTLRTSLDKTVFHVPSGLLTTL